nr:MAG TPA: hypothetical protein [Caudoviricetes sp.]
MPFLLSVGLPIFEPISFTFLFVAHMYTIAHMCPKSQVDDLFCNIIVTFLK